ncbi:MAG: hypothetical protein JNK02_14050 [Planctomycetes bacterium]|nr:hypothetical protein [Planctomycetota bacterium]
MPALRCLLFLLPPVIPTAIHAQTLWESCGTLVSHPTYGVLFQGDPFGTLLWLTNTGGYQVGSRVHVAGLLGNCSTGCGPLNCLRANTIDACAPCQWTPICGASSSAVPCPCGGSHGCANSRDAGGAWLVVAGGASLTDDETVFRPWRMPNSSTAVDFQGTAAIEVPFGDGQLCAAGPLVRLATRFNLGGQSLDPDVGEPRISVMGQITAPGTRYDQVWYRDVATFCTPATFNFTDGVEIAWAP